MIKTITDIKLLQLSIMSGDQTVNQCGQNPVQRVGGLGNKGVQKREMLGIWECIIQ